MATSKSPLWDFVRQNAPVCSAFAALIILVFTALTFFGYRIATDGLPIGESELGAPTAGVSEPAKTAAPPDNAEELSTIPSKAEIPKKPEASPDAPDTKPNEPVGLSEEPAEVVQIPEGSFDKSYREIPISGCSDIAGSPPEQVCTIGINSRISPIIAREEIPVELHSISGSEAEMDIYGRYSTGNGPKFFLRPGSIAGFDVTVWNPPQTFCLKILRVDSKKENISFSFWHSPTYRYCSPQ